MVLQCFLKSQSSRETRERAGPQQGVRKSASVLVARWRAQMPCDALYISNVTRKKMTTQRVWFAKWKTQRRVQVRASSDSGEISLSVLCGVESKRVELHPSRILSHIRGFALARRSITLLIHSHGSLLSELFLTAVNFWNSLQPSNHSVKTRGRGN